MQSLKQRVESELRRHLDLLLPRHVSAEAYSYIVFPAGKLFRPQLAWHAAQDLGHASEHRRDLSLWASALELHHAYTLVHDDLPCMDDDDVRRGRPSAHKAFSEWQALLAGDGLLNLSYGLMGRMQHPRALSLVRLSSHLLGPKGLILGQAMDLSGEMAKGPEQLLLTHELKTSRLLQAALIGGAVLADAPGGLPLVKSLHRLGRDLGLAFQLLDDLQELGAPNLSEHEAKVNPWPRFPEECYHALSACLESCGQKTSEMPGTRAFLSEFWASSFKDLNASKDQILEHAPEADVGTILQGLARL